jgi:hypothetical protein
MRGYRRGAQKTINKPGAKLWFRYCTDTTTQPPGSKTRHSNSHYQLSPPSHQPTSEEVEVNIALTYALWQDGFMQALEYANQRKKSFDKKANPASFQPGDLVQRYDA